jgi:hypothetical protein
VQALLAGQIIVALSVCTAALSSQAQPPPEPIAEAPIPIPEDPRDTAKREAWTSAVLIVSLLEQGDNREFPGIRAWLEDFRRVAALTPQPEPGRPFPTLDADALVTRNARFWSAFYEVQPGDPGLALLHAALLLSGGEAQRAAAIASFGLQRPGVPEETKRALHSLIAQCHAAQSHSMDLVRLGVRLHDMREFAAAVKQYDEALAEWPANGCAHYERGFSLRMKAIAEARSKGYAPESAEEPPPDPPETAAAFARARQHDPLHLLAYQGEDGAIKTALLALVRAGFPAWEAIRKRPEQPVRPDALRDFSEACGEATIDDFALVLRQLVVAGRRHYAEDDAVLIRTVLHRLAPEALTPPLLARLDGSERLPTRQIVIPLAPDPPELARTDGTAPDEPAPKAQNKKKSGKTSGSASPKKKKRKS